MSRLPTQDPETGELNAVIETPKGSRNKYNYDEGCGRFRLAGVMPEGTSFPYDFGFIPSTRGDDGDPLDVLILLDTPAIVGCVLTIRLIGAIEAKQREKNGDWIRNDRLLAVATHAHTHQDIKALSDLRPRMLDEIEAFFIHYNELNGKQFKPIDRAGPNKARKLLDRGASAFRGEQSDASDRIPR